MPAKIAILGTRGIPVSYGGFEPVAKRVAIYLAERGHEVAVYGLRTYAPPDAGAPYHGVRRVWLPSVRQKALEKPLAALASTAHAAFHRADAVLMFGVSPVLFAPVSRLARQRLVVNVDGLEWRRRKWGLGGRAFLRLSEWLATRSAHTLIADGRAVQNHYMRSFGVLPVFIPYGGDVDGPQPGDAELLAPFGLEPRGYVLQVCRLEPENNSDWVIQEYRRSGIEVPLAIVGDAPYAGAYQRRLQELASDRVRLLGRLRGQAYRAVQRNAALYVHAHEVGGTNPSLLEALGAGNCVIALDVEFNREVLGGCGAVAGRATGALAASLRDAMAHDHWRESQRDAARDRVRARYRWEAVLEAYEAVLLGYDLDEPYERRIASLSDCHERVG